MSQQGQTVEDQARAKLRLLEMPEDEFISTLRGVAHATREEVRTIDPDAMIPASEAVSALIPLVVYLEAALDMIEGSNA